MSDLGVFLDLGSPDERLVRESAARRDSILGQLPGVLRGDPFVQRLVAGFQEVVEPVQADVESVSSFFDRDLAPLPFLRWMLRWLGLPSDDAMAPEAVGRLLEQADYLLRHRGTLVGLNAAVVALVGPGAVVDQTVAVAAVSASGTWLDASAAGPTEAMGVTVGVPGLGSFDDVSLWRLRSLIEMFVPLNVTTRLVDLGEGGPQ